MHRTRARVRLRLRAHERGEPGGVRGRSSTPGSRCASASTCSRSTSTPRPRPRTLPLDKAAPPRPRPACSRSTTSRSTRSGASARSGSRTRSTATPASRFRVGHDADRVVAYAITGLAGRYGYLQRVAVHPDARFSRLGPRARRRRPGLGVEAGRRPRLREHATGEPSRRSRSTGRSGSTSSPRACASSGAHCDRHVSARCATHRFAAVLALTLVAVPLTAFVGHRAAHAGGAVVRVSAGQSPGSPPDGTFMMQLPGRQRARPAARSCSRCTTRSSRGPRSTPASAAAACPPSRELHPRSRSTRCPPTPPAHRSPRGTRHQHLHDSGVYPLEVDLRDAADDSLAHFVTHVVVGRPRRRRPRSPSAYPSRSPGSGHCGRTPPTSPTWAGAHQRRTTARRPPADGPPRPPGDPTRGNADVPLTLAPSPRRSTRGTRSRRSPPDLAAGAAAVRTAGQPAQPGAHRPVRPPRPAGDPARGLAGVRDHTARSHGASPRSRRSSAPTSTRAPRCPDRSTSPRCGCCRTRSVRQLVVDGDAAHPGDREVHARAPVQGGGRTPGDDSSAVTVARHRSWVRAVPLAATTRPHCARRTCWPGSRSWPASSRASPAASPS